MRPATENLRTCGLQCESLDFLVWTCHVQGNIIMMMDLLLLF
jgi:hypothetical protein